MSVRDRLLDQQHTDQAIMRKEEQKRQVFELQPDGPELASVPVRPIARLILKWMQDNKVPQKGDESDEMISQILEDPEAKIPGARLDEPLGQATGQNRMERKKKALQDEAQQIGTGKKAEAYMEAHEKVMQVLEEIGAEGIAEQEMRKLHESVDLGTRQRITKRMTQLLERQGSGGDITPPAHYQVLFGKNFPLPDPDIYPASLHHYDSAGERDAMDRIYELMQDRYRGRSGMRVIPKEKTAEEKDLVKKLKGLRAEQVDDVILMERQRQNHLSLLAWQSLDETPKPGFPPRSRWKMLPENLTRELENSRKRMLHLQRIKRQEGKIDKDAALAAGSVSAISIGTMAGAIKVAEKLAERDPEVQWLNQRWEWNKSFRDSDINLLLGGKKKLEDIDPELRKKMEAAYKNAAPIDLKRMKILQKHYPELEHLIQRELELRKIFGGQSGD